MKVFNNKVKGYGFMKRLFVLFLMVFLLVPTANATISVDLYQCSDWARKDVEKALSLGIDSHSGVGDYREPITRGSFADNAASLVAIEFGSNLKSYLAIMNYRGMAENTDFPHLYVSHIIEDLGILKGREDGNLDTGSYITRQEAAVILARTYRAYHDKVPNNLTPLSFPDQDDIAVWAVDDVQLMNHLGIMTGIDGNRFDPQGSYTIEQCLVTLLRLHEQAPYDGSKQENPFAIPAWEGGFHKVWDDGRLAFAIETKEYYIYSWTQRVPLHGPFYFIEIIDQDLSLRSYQTAIITSSNYYCGETLARPENAYVSKDGKKLFYTATVDEDVYNTDEHWKRGAQPVQQKGIYTVTMDLETGEQTYTRAELSEN